MINGGLTREFVVGEAQPPLWYEFKICFWNSFKVPLEMRVMRVPAFLDFLARINGGGFFIERGDQIIHK